jgi:hypothetical protein
MGQNMSSRDFLLQQDWRKRIIERIGNEQWFLAYLDIHTDQENGGLYCALIPNESIEKALSQPSWDLSMGSGFPGCVTYYEGSEERTTYHRFGDDTGIEPLVFLRNFYGIRKPYLELSEEYRHFHNLYYDPKNNHYVKISDDGNEEVVVRISNDRVEMRLLEVRQFLAIKEMHLASFFDIVRYSDMDLTEIGPDDKATAFREGLICYRFHVSPCDFSMKPENKSFSRLFGKKLIPPLPKEQSGMRPYETKEKDYEKFIIGIDKNVALVSYTSDPDRLANYFGANPGAPNYLTPVFFRRQVLAKYYANPEKFSVEDGYLRCGGLWGLRMDNNHPEYVIVFLGDLGSDLPHSEQLYWRSFNVLPEGGISKVNFRRSFLAQFADPERPDLFFKYMFENFTRRWREHFGWDFFIPLSEKDAHFYTTLRVPLSNDQAEFDGQVLALTKILIDSINEKKLAAELGGSQAEEKGISKLSRYLDKARIVDAAKYVTFLHDLQDLRSTGVAHRKGSQYDKVSARFGIGEKDLMKIFEDILMQACEFISALDRLLPPKKE